MIELESKIHRLLEKAVDDSYVAGVNLLVMRNGEEILYTQAGFADRNAGKPYRRDTIVRMFSMSKPVTGAAVMHLMEQGLLDLQMPIEEMLPAFRDIRVCEDGKMVLPHRPIVVRDLLSMTSGLPYPGVDPVGRAVDKVMEELYLRSSGDHPYTTQDVAAELAKCGLCFHPGQKWMYGTSADVLGAIVEKASGMGFAEYLKQNFFDPLGMQDTAFYVPADKRDRLAMAYEQTAEGLEEYHTHNLGILDTYDAEPPFASGGAGLFSTIDDYEKFARMLLQKGAYGGRRILSPKTVEFFTNPRLSGCTLDKDWTGLDGFDYGNLIRVMVEPGKATFCGWKGEYGWDGWLGTYFCNSPENGVTVLMTMQKKDAGMTELARRIRNVLFADLY